MGAIDWQDVLPKETARSCASAVEVIGGAALKRGEALFKSGDMAELGRFLTDLGPAGRDLFKCYVAYSAGSACTGALSWAGPLAPVGGVACAEAAAWVAGVVYDFAAEVGEVMFGWLFGEEEDPTVKKIRESAEQAAKVRKKYSEALSEQQRAMFDAFHKVFEGLIKLHKRLQLPGPYGYQEIGQRMLAMDAKSNLLMTREMVRRYYLPRQGHSGNVTGPDIDGYLASARTDTTDTFPLNVWPFLVKTPVAYRPPRVGTLYDEEKRKKGTQFSVGIERRLYEHAAAYAGIWLAALNLFARSEAHALTDFAAQVKAREYAPQLAMVSAAQTARQYGVKRVVGDEVIDTRFALPGFGNKKGTTAAPSDPCKKMVLGTTGSQVTAMQKRLNEILVSRGYETIAVTGVLDKPTCGATVLARGTLGFSWASIGKLAKRECPNGLTTYGCGPYESHAPTKAETGPSQARPAETRVDKARIGAGTILVAAAAASVGLYAIVTSKKRS